MEEDAVDTGINCMFEHFSESELVHEIIDDVVNIFNIQKKTNETDQELRLRTTNLLEIAYEKLKRILNQYIDQSHLLDPYISHFLEKLICYIKDPLQKLEVKQEIFRYMFLFVNVRGFKVIVRLLPHEVTDLEPALALLESQSPNEFLKWETRYCLLLWLSIIVMIPFDMSKLDRPDATEKIAERVLKCCKASLMTTDKSRDAAAYLCAKFVNRIDIKEIYLAEIIQWASDHLTPQKKSQSWVKFGPLMALASILKHGKREDLQPHTEKIFCRIREAKCLQDTYRLSRKFAIKIIQRIGLCHLKVRVAFWRYQRGCRSLALNSISEGFTESETILNVNEVNQGGDVPTEEYDDVPDIVERVVAEILSSLEDDDITTRWSAAKGIGRVTERLSPEFCHDIVSNILELFSPRKTSGSWNGACLALAELGRRGLILSTELKMVIKLLLKALVYEETKGYAGSYVRDSACYTCWSLARAYDPEILRPYVNDLAGGLLIVACFDREMNCRKAASAAFQEHVGRQGTFPHGIDILTVADYFAVSIRKNAFLNVSTHIAQYSEYTCKMIDHLVECKIGYSDAEIRDLSAKALHNLLVYNPAYMADRLKDIVKNFYSVNLNLRHGAILAVGEIITGLTNINGHNFKYDENVVVEIKELIPKFQNHESFRGIGGDMMKEVCCFLIMKCSIAKFPVEDELIERWSKLIHECLPYELDKVRQSAAFALSALIQCHYVTAENVSVLEKCQPIIEKCRNQVIYIHNETNRIGYAIALSVLPKCVLSDFLDDIITSLTECAVKNDVTSKWVNSRKAAHESLVTIWKTFYIDAEPSDITSLRISPILILKVLLKNLSDYTVDRRGDIGSIVRESSVKGLQVIVIDTCRIDKTIIPNYLMEEIIIGIARQALDKISRIRACATYAFYEILNCDIPQISHLSTIKEIFSNVRISDINWTRECVTFPLFAQLLQFPEFTRPLLCAFIKCIGSVTESLVKDTSDALTEYFKKLSEDELVSVCNIIRDEFQEESRQNRTSKSMLVFLERMFAFEIFKPVLKLRNSFAADIYRCLRTEVTRTKDSEKLTACVEIFCQLLQTGGQVSKYCLKTLCILLCHSMIWLRRAVAVSLDQALDMYAEECDLSDENEEKAKEILREYNWENPSMEEIRSTRNQLCVLFGVEPPLPIVREVA